MQAQYIGVRAGYNYATLSGETTAGSSVRNNHGIYAGVTLEFPLSRFFSFQTEATYSRVGAKLSSESLGSAHLTLDYLCAPALAKINIYEGLSLHTGPQFNFLINNNDFSFEKDEVFTAVSHKAVDSFDMSLVVGVNYRTSFGWCFEARFNQGLTNILESEESSLTDTGFSPNYNFKNTVLSIGVGYVF
ncbi:hypothetical protein RCZ01_03320 [Capnocytophaga felis]|uniref:Outer membrane protein beta-barrel domain-containing protein n=2 Tax=Capnocytophaga felis TaxID=2267611 RepID=A0A5M4B6P6_9FLAO|nr:hypothetical protein RCZ01_03320 [Capnocytophaga felis]GET47806.1 hypothetical protein RCZ02_06370 [Capnocytophaga felis]